MEDTLHAQRIAQLHHQRERAARRLAEVSQVEGRYPWFRLAAFLLFLLGAYIAFSLLPFFAGLAASLALLAVFVGVTVAHRRVLAAQENYRAIERLARTRVARAELDWEHVPAHLPASPPPEHPFDRDLIVTGPRSLHQIIDCAASLGGSRRLAAWLLAGSPDPALVQQRQTLVRELLALPGLRARLALDGALIAGEAHADRWDGDSLIDWLNQDTHNPSIRPVLILLGLLAVANITLFALSAFGLFPPFWIATFLVYFAIQGYTFRESSDVFNEAYSLALRLGQLRSVLSDLETYPFQKGSRLEQLCAPFTHGPERPSRALRQVSLIATAASIRNNPFLALILNILVPWDLFFSYQLDRYKHKLRALLPTWLEALYELEALNSLAWFASLNPAYTFPEVLPSISEPVFQAAALGHPLIPYKARVTNDFDLPKLGDLVLITGSNMSGKSTFLRTVGANLVLAFAGSVVAAESFQASPVRPFASMNVADSLSDGISYFYAEVRRLKQLLDRLRDNDSSPLFYLIDEIFRGTNNRERRIGSESYLRALAGGRGAGLISTHDLELVHLAQEIPEIRNYHFREDVRDGKMVFDFKLREGPSPTTNALRIMALAGLPVDRDLSKMQG